MSQPQILEKLSKKLQSVPQSEEDLVYILSRIRKILEINSYPDEFKFLKFYCDLALHSTIDRAPEAIADRIKGLYDDTNTSLIFLRDFHDEFTKFLDSFNLPNFYKNGV